MAILRPVETTEFLTEAVAVLATAVAVVLLSARLRLPPVVGFLISGVLIGPSGLALVPEAEQVEVGSLKPADTEIAHLEGVVAGRPEFDHALDDRMVIYEHLGLIERALAFQAAAWRRS